MLTCFGPRGVVFLPQRPFFTDGSLREQVNPGTASTLLPALAVPYRKACKRQDGCDWSFPHA